MPVLTDHVIAQAVFPSTTGLGEDVVTNTFHFNKLTNTFAAAAPLIRDAIVSFYNDVPTGGNSIATYLSSTLSRTANACKVKVYDGSVEPGLRVPIEYSWTLGPAQVGMTIIPREVATCLSYRTDYGVLPGPSSRGRIFFGPLGTNALDASPVGDARVLPILQQSMRTSAKEELYDDLVAADIFWSVYSPTLNTMSAVTNVWTDNAFDIQRRRGAKASSRTNLAL